VDAVRGLEDSKPVLTVFMSARGFPEVLQTAEVRVPSYAFPEAAAIALARVARYGEWRARPPSAPPRLEGLRRDEAAALVAGALQRGEGWLTPEEVAGLLMCYGLPVVPQRVAAGPEAAGEAAREMRGKVALKAIAAGLVHKTDLGGVRLDLEGPEEVRRAAEGMGALLASKGHPLTGFLIQQMVPEGVEMLVGVVHDPQFGPVVACGAGGVLVELLRDVSVRLAPLTPEDASEMVRSLKTFPLLTGFRGAPPGDIQALEDALLRVSALAEDLPQVAEVDLNPIRVHPAGAAIVDARVRVSPFERPPFLGRDG
jgi:acyl-CoA synthetase (NDP forming)